MKFEFNHLQDVNETYFEHFKFAMGMALRLLWGGTCIAIHAVLPFAFVSNGSETIKKCYSIITEKFPQDN